MRLPPLPPWATEEQRWQRAKEVARFNSTMAGLMLLAAIVAAIGFLLCATRVVMNNQSADIQAEEAR